MSHNIFVTVNQYYVPSFLVVGAIFRKIYLDMLLNV